MRGLKGRIELMEKLVRWSEDTSPVSISLGYTKDGFCYRGVVIRECPPSIVDNLVGEGYSLTMTSEGLLVHDYRTQK